MWKYLLQSRSLRWFRFWLWCFLWHYVGSHALKKKIFFLVSLMNSINGYVLFCGKKKCRLRIMGLWNLGWNFCRNKMILFCIYLKFRKITPTLRSHWPKRQWVGRRMMHALNSKGYYLRNFPQPSFQNLNGDQLFLELLWLIWCKEWVGRNLVNNLKGRLWSHFSFAIIDKEWGQTW